MRRTFTLALLFVVAFASLTYAQAVTTGTGAINGRVTDTSDAVMPGVTVTITSPSQMGVRTEVTDADGSYRFSAVTPGDYAVVFITGHAGEGDQIRALRAGALDYVPKPVTLRTLTSKIPLWRERAAAVDVSRRP